MINMIVSHFFILISIPYLIEFYIVKWYIEVTIYQLRRIEYEKHEEKTI